MTNCTVIKILSTNYMTTNFSNGKVSFPRRWAAKCPTCAVILKLPYNKNSRKAAKDALYFHMRTLH